MVWSCVVGLRFGAEQEARGVAEEEVERTKAELQQARDEVRTHTSTQALSRRLPCVGLTGLVGHRWRGWVVV